MSKYFTHLLAAWLMLSGAVTVLAASETLPDEVVINGVELSRVPAGEFWYLVATDYPNRRKFGSKPFREVRIWLDEYYVGKYEARARDFVRFLNSGKARQDWIGDPQYWLPEVDGCAVAYVPGKGYQERYPEKDFPATAVSWDLANDFAVFMGFRLPTEAEWQKAARGTDRRIWPWGYEHPDETFANYALGVYCAPAPVTAYPKGRSPYGIYNLAGNVAEWVSNWYNLDFDQRLKNGDRNPDLPLRGIVADDVFRHEMKFVKGGRWGSIAGSISIGMRELGHPAHSNSSSGLRFVVDAAVVRTRLQDGSATILREKR